MKFTFSTVLFTFLCVVVLAIESVYGLPVVALLLFMTQQPLFSEYERVVIAITCGVILAVMYHLPLAVGMVIFAVLAAVYQLEWWKTREQVRDVVVVLIACVVIFLVGTRTLPQLGDLGRFTLYFLVVVGVLRLWQRRRRQLFKK